MIGAERMKADVGHTVPLTPAAVDLLAGLPRFAAGDFVFSGQTGAKPFSGFSKAKARLDRMAGSIAPFTLHDLRRTVRTRLAELGVTPFVGELVIGHAQRGVHAVYDLHRYTARSAPHWRPGRSGCSPVAPNPSSTGTQLLPRCRCVTGVNRGLHRAPAVYIARQREGLALATGEPHDWHNQCRPWGFFVPRVGTHTKET